MTYKPEGPFPANVPEAGRFQGPSPTFLEQVRKSSGGLSDDPTESGNPVDNGATPYTGMRSK